MLANGGRIQRFGNASRFIVILTMYLLMSRMDINFINFRPLTKPKDLTGLHNLQHLDNIWISNTLATFRRRAAFRHQPFEL